MTADELLGLLRDTAQGASNSAASTVSAPVDVLAWLLRKGGVPVGPAPVLGSDWMAQKGLTAQPKNALAGMAGETIGNILPIVASAKAPQIANALMRADEALTNQLGPTIANAAEQYMAKTGMMQPATVWHGSPHKFDKFDSAHIGKGEGAQAYGHGLYVAEATNVAQKYADDLSSWSISTRDGVKNGGDFADHLVANAGDYPPSLSSAIRSQANKIATDLSAGKPAEQIVASMRNGPYKRMYGGLADAVEKLAPTKAGGFLYKVDLPDSAIAKMLDWDKPLSQQAPEVQKALAPFLQQRETELRQLWKAFPENDIERELARMSKDTGAGQAIYEQAGYKTATGDSGASEYLRSLGIPGIRYLDGGSRGAGAGTSNYVVFPGEENMLRILERNGVPIGN